MAVALAALARSLLLLDQSEFNATPGMLHLLIQHSKKGRQQSTTTTTAHRKQGLRKHCKTWNVMWKTTEENCM
eukprot:4743977-Amphidinium_carterae.1